MIRPLLFFTFSLLISNQTNCQNTKRNIRKSKLDNIVNKTNLAKQDSFNCWKFETAAEFPGGNSAWEKYVQQNLNVNIAKINGAPVGIYNVVVLFIICKDGSTSVFRCTTNFGYGMESEVIRLIEKSPKWIPATQNGRIVNGYKRQTLTFSVLDLTVTGTTNSAPIIKRQYFKI